MPVLVPPHGTREAGHPRWLLVLIWKVGKAGLFPAVTSNRPGDEPVSGKPQSPAGRINSQCALLRREEERAGMDTRRLTVARLGRIRLSGLVLGDADGRRRSPV